MTFNLPTISPVDSQNMNYTSAAVGVVAAISAVTWCTTGRKAFTGPRIGEAEAEFAVLDVRDGLAGLGEGSGEGEKQEEEEGKVRNVI